MLDFEQVKFYSDTTWREGPFLCGPTQENAVSIFKIYLPLVLGGSPRKHAQGANSI